MKNLFSLTSVLLGMNLSLFAQLPVGVDTTGIQEVIQEQIENTVEPVAAPVDTIKFVQDEVLKKPIPPVPVQAANKFPPIGIYGHDFLRDNNFAFYQNATQTRVAEDYVLGAGDELVASIWDNDQAITELLVISQDGFVQGPKFGRVYLAGVEFSKAREVIKAKYNPFYNFGKARFDLALTAAKVISIDIVGDVEVPGTYKLSAVNKLFNAIKLSGGPTRAGSVRAIQVKRAGKVHKTIDVYKFLNDPASSDMNIYLQDNDVIFIPKIQDAVLINGPVRKTNKRYELKKSETFEDLIYYAGGFLPRAVKTTFQLKRYSEDDYFIRDFDYNVKQPSLTKVDLENGDVVTIKEIAELIENGVSSEGAFNQPGQYEYIQNMRISDLIEKSGGLRFDALTSRAFLERFDENLEKVNIPIDIGEIVNNPDSEQDLQLYPKDRVAVFSKTKFVENFSVEIFGEIKSPGSYNYSKELSLEDLVLLAGGFKTSALNSEIQISRVVGYSEENGQLVPIRNTLDKTEIDFSFIDTPDSERTMLVPYDQIFVRSVPDFELPRNIRIDGEVKYPGSYPLQTKDMRVSDLIDLSGGVTPYAFIEGAKLYRAEDAKGLIEINLSEVERRPSSKYNYVLKPGDRLEIPTIDEVVTIKGAIQNVLDDQRLINTAYRGDKNAKWYINEFGAGFDKKALRRSTQVVDPNGKLNGTRKFLMFNVYPKVSPGSEINVTYKPPKEEKPPRKAFLGDLNAQETLALIASIASTIALIQATR